MDYLPLTHHLLSLFNKKQKNQKNQKQKIEKEKNKTKREEEKREKGLIVLGVENQQASDFLALSPQEREKERERWKEIKGGKGKEKKRNRGLFGFGSVEEMAVSYAKEIREYLEKGERREGEEVVVVGWSFGGVVGMEVGRELEKGGIKVGRVVMLDSYTKTEGVVVVGGEGERKGEEEKEVVVRELVEGSLSLLVDHSVVPSFSFPVLLVKALLSHPEEKMNGWDEGREEGGRRLVEEVECVGVECKHEEMVEVSRVVEVVAEVVGERIL